MPKLAAGAGIAPAFAPSKGAVLRLDDPAINGGPPGRNFSEGWSLGKVLPLRFLGADKA